MAGTLAFPIMPSTVGSLEFVLSERRKVDPATPSRDMFLAQVVEDAITVELERPSAANPKLKPGKRS